MDQYVSLPRRQTVTVPRGARVLMVAPERTGAAARETLANIVKACGLRDGDDCVTAYLREDAMLSIEEAGCSEVVVFGLRPRDVGLAIEAPAYRWTPTLAGRRYCFAERLSLISEDMARKKRLWSSIKSLKPPTV